MIHTTYIGPKTSTDLKDISSQTSLINKKKKRKYVSVSLGETPRPPIRAHDIFLNLCRKEYASVEIVMNTGEIIEGIIDCYDNETIVLHNDLAQLLIYKHSVSYISPRNGKHMILPDRQNYYTDQFTLVRNTPCTTPKMRQSSSSNGIGS
ncbi:MAG: RNA chaperone Hfq [Clostridiales bacterium]|nr:RNA chaperone Hfq [Clostridiales bacterium]